MPAGSKDTLLTQSEAALFQSYILRWYHRHGRHELPWRQTNDPYAILVSELMLQQTQVERVIPKFLAFIDRFPTVEHLASAPLSQVLTLWQGLGYNRRAKFLHLSAKEVTQRLAGIFPTSYEALLGLPGVGPYTASAVMSFAYNKPLCVIETNIRAVFLYHFFYGKQGVSDADLTPLISQTLVHSNPAQWYAALMDYGSVLKKNLPNPSRKSKHHVQQSSFKGSLRQTRGEIIRALTIKKLPLSQLKAHASTNPEHFNKALSDLLAEKIVVQHKDLLSLPE